VELHEALRLASLDFPIGMECLTESEALIGTEAIAGQTVEMVSVEYSSTTNMTVVQAVEAHSASMSRATGVELEEVALVVEEVGSGGCSHV